jgi:hypothetical protein
MKAVGAAVQCTSRCSMCCQISTLYAYDNGIVAPR